jgi:hypothetical protein
MPKVVKVTKVVARLQELIGEHGGVRQLSEHLEVSDEAIYMILRGTRPPTGKVLEATGFRKVIRYARIET